MDSNSDSTKRPLSEKQLAHLRNIASLGGQALVQKRGRQHMAEIGRRGFKTTVNRYFGGDSQAANEWLAKMGRYATDIPEIGRVWKHPGPHPAHQNPDQQQE